MNNLKRRTEYALKQAGFHKICSDPDRQMWEKSFGKLRGIISYNVPKYNDFGTTVVHPDGVSSGFFNLKARIHKVDRAVAKLNKCIEWVEQRPKKRRKSK